MSRFLVSANSELEMAAIRGRLSDAGIPVLAQGALQDKGVEFASSRDIYVDDRDLERARAVLAEGSDFSDDDLAALSQQAFEEATESPTQLIRPKGIDPKTGEPYEPVEIPAPKVSRIRAAIRGVAKPIKRDEDE